MQFRIHSLENGNLTRTELIQVRRRLGLTQKQMAQLLVISIKAVQSFEQGWRNIPVHVERQALLLLVANSGSISHSPPCWQVMECEAKRRRSCPAWRLKTGNLCWLVNGTSCHGKPQKSWPEKMSICRHCPMFPLVAETLA